ncbi:MAG: polysaccharide biosynthesis protein [Verrucomicrobia bacterium]|nr:MAG: polysaccharide biosynthesis protein [Verrucomicrobiota bacterium]
MLVCLYSVVLAGALIAAYLLRWDFSIPQSYVEQCLWLLVPVVVCKLLLLGSFGQFRAMLSYFSLHDFACIVVSNAVATAAMFVVWLFTTEGAAPPRGVILIDNILAVGGLAAVRLGLRILHNRSIRIAESPGRVFSRAVIIGAGDTGSALVNDLLTKPGFGVVPAFFLDDDPKKWGRQLHGIRIFGPIEKLPEMAQIEKVSEAILTMPGAGPRKVAEVIRLAQYAGLKTSIVPSFTQLAAGQVQVNRFRPVELEDLLGREPAVLDSESIDELIRDRVVMVTGAGGSIGSELCRQIAARKPKQLLLVDQSEVQLFQIEQELVSRTEEGVCQALVADVLDTARIHEIFGRYRPSVVFHAAAHKHVFMMERQPAEAVKNNFVGTHRLAQAARSFGVERFVLISTDKAINPTSVMGATKRLAEYAIQAAQSSPGNKTKFMAVRFGNVLGSSGSVIPIFKRQIAAGGPVTVTHPEVTRYFMTIPEAVGLVLQAATMGEGGEVFVLDMGTPMKIVNVARQLIQLSGFKPDVDIEIKFIGLRPGEKLYEELQHRGENLDRTAHSRVMRLRSEPIGREVFEACVSELAGAVYSLDDDDLKLLIKKYVPEYTPHLSTAKSALEGGENAKALPEAGTGNAATEAAGAPAETATGGEEEKAAPEENGGAETDAADSPRQSTSAVGS